MGGAVLTYSPNGNLTTNELGRQLIYDGWNRLGSVYASDGAQVARYEYDGLNRRIVEQVGASAFNAAVRDSYSSQDWQVREERVRHAGEIPTRAWPARPVHHRPRTRRPRPHQDPGHLCPA